VLRRIARERTSHSAVTPALDTPEWLMARWTRTYGTEIARAIASAHGHEPPLDLTVKSDPGSWAARLRGRALATGTVRLTPHGPVPRLPGFAEGAWWVQDAAAALPARLLGDVQGLRVADLCAAPGGKTAQLVLAGAHVTAIDRSPGRIARVRENLARLGLVADIVVADALEWQGEPFDAVLVDAPCSSTGTVRRHPDIPYLKREEDIATMAALQRRLIDRAVALTRPGGTIVYCSCSLEPEEGEAQVAALMEREARVRRSPILASELVGLPAKGADGAAAAAPGAGAEPGNGLDQWVTAAGELRTLPCHLPDPDPRIAGLDGFYAARLLRL